MSRLRSIENNLIVENIDNTPSDNVYKGPDDDYVQENRTVDVWEDLSDSESLGYNVLKPSPNVREVFHLLGLSMIFQFASTR